jgi:hypothetical protein
MKVFRKKPARPTITHSEAMRCIPVKSSLARETRLEGGLIQLDYPAVIRPWIAGLIRRFGGDSENVRMRKLQLDELGTAVWDMLDGQKTVNQVIDQFSSVQKLHRREATVSVTLFLRELGKRGLIAMR